MKGPHSQGLVNESSVVFAEQFWFVPSSNVAFACAGIQFGDPSFWSLKVGKLLVTYKRLTVKFLAPRAGASTPWKRETCWCSAGTEDMTPINNPLSFVRESGPNLFIPNTRTRRHAPITTARKLYPATREAKGYEQGYVLPLGQLNPPRSSSRSRWIGRRSEPPPPVILVEGADGAVFLGDMFFRGDKEACQ